MAHEAEASKKSSQQIPRQSRRLRDPLVWARWLDRAALFLLLLVIGSRPLVSETYESVLRMMERATDAGDSLTPAATAWFDMAIWLAAITATVAIGLRRWEWRWSGLEVGWVLMAVGAVLSVWSAGNRRVALNASCDWLTALVMAMVLVNLVRDRFRVTLVLSVIVATGLVSFTKSAMQKGVEFREMRQQYELNKADFWNRQGVPLDDPTVELFERRMQASEASGFLPYSNAQGALLSLAGFAALALRGVRVRTLWPQTMLLLVAWILMAGTMLTGSRAAVIGVVIGLLLWRLLEALHVRLRPRWRLAWITVWLLIAAGVAGLVGVGIRSGGLPGASLDFRWQYWQVTAEIIRDNLWTGVGALNFDRHYMQRKPIDFPEEIRDPHNFFLSLLAQWGLAGGLGALLAVLGGSLLLARAWGRHTPEDEPATVEEHVALARGKGWVLLVAGAFLLLRLWLLYSPWDTTTAQQAMLWFDMGFYGLVWATALILFQWLSTTGRNAEVDYYRIPLLCGVGAFLLHNMIEFSLFVPGTLTLMAAMIGVLLAKAPRPQVPDGPTHRLAVMPVLAGCGVMAFAVSTLLPVTRGSAALTRARHQEEHSAAVAGFLAAAQADPRDPTPWAEAAAAQAQDTRAESLNHAARYVEEALNRDPDDGTFHRLKAALLLLRYDVVRSASDLWSAAGAARRCVELYPASPERQADLGSVLEKLATDLGADEFRLEAIQCYRKALELNAARPGAEELRRWPASRVQELEAHIEALVATPASAPTEP